ncbi:MAG: HNH endonuclease signature motif containing protein [Opitutaceae bacterium]
MDELPYIDNPEILAKELWRLVQERENGKQPAGSSTRLILTREQRIRIHQKTDGRCHVCGCEVPVEGFEADHVKNHTSGGLCDEENFLPSCRTCNNYRWHYIPQELQWILKIGVWSKTQMTKETKIGKEMMKAFISHDSARERRRKHPREPQGCHQDGVINSESLRYSP